MNNLFFSGKEKMLRIVRGDTTIDIEEGDYKKSQFFENLSEMERSPLMIYIFPHFFNEEDLIFLVNVLLGKEITLSEYFERVEIFRFFMIEGKNINFRSDFENDVHYLGDGIFIFDKNSTSGMKETLSSLPINTKIDYPTFDIKFINDGFFDYSCCADEKIHVSRIIKSITFCDAQNILLYQNIVTNEKGLFSLQKIHSSPDRINVFESNFFPENIEEYDLDALRRERSIHPSDEEGQFPFYDESKIEVAWGGRSGILRYAVTPLFDKIKIIKNWDVNGTLLPGFKVCTDFDTSNRVSYLGCGYENTIDEIADLFSVSSISNKEIVISSNKVSINEVGDTFLSEKNIEWMLSLLPKIDFYGKIFRFLRESNSFEKFEEKVEWLCSCGKNNQELTTCSYFRGVIIC